MFLKLKVDGSDKITKIKYEGQALAELREIISKKLDLQFGFDLKYVDEDQDTVIIKDDDDWSICKESTQDISKSTAGNPSNLSLIVTPHQAPAQPPVSQPQPVVVTAQTPVQEEKIKLCSQANAGNDYPTPPVVQQQPTITMTTATAPVFQPILHDYVSTLFGPKGKPTRTAAVIHHDIVCDNCGMGPIQGVRYKSVTLNDFDLCETCANSDKYCTSTMIRIPYFNREENKTGYSQKEFPQIIKQFSKFVNEPVSEDLAAMIKLLKEVFNGADAKKIETFTKKHQGKSFNDMYTLYIKENHC